MAAKKKPPTRRKESAPTRTAWQIILEDIRSQNRMTIEAVETSRAALEERLERLDRESQERDSTLAVAIRALKGEVSELRASVQQNSVDIRQLQGDVQQGSVDMRQLQANVEQLRGDVQQHSVDIRALTAKIEVLTHIEERVTALEKRR